MEFFPSLLPSTLVLFHFLLFFFCFPLCSVLFPVFSPSQQLPSLLHHHRSAQSHLRHRSAEPSLHLPSINLPKPQTDVSRFGSYKTRSVNISSFLHHTYLTTMLYSLPAPHRNLLHLRPANTRRSVSHTRPRVDLTLGRVVHTLRSVDSCHPHVAPPICPSPAYLHPYRCFVVFGSFDFGPPVSITGVCTSRSDEWLTLDGPESRSIAGAVEGFLLSLLYFALLCVLYFCLLCFVVFLWVFISLSYSSLIFLWRLLHQPEIGSPLQQSQMGIQCLSFNSFLLEGVVVSKLVRSLASLKHHFDGAISWSVDQDPKDRAIFWPISYLFIFSALYYCFGFVVGEPNPFSVF